MKYPRASYRPPPALPIPAAWFDVQPGPRDPETLARGRKLDEAGIAESVQIVEDLISAEEANGIPVSRIVIGGFSQGGMIALKVATNRPTRVGGVVALSTFFQVPDDATVTDSVKATPVFVGHGTTDPIIPVQSAQIIEDFLAKLEIKDVNRHYYPGVPHASCVEEFRDFKKFLLDVVPDDA